MPAKKTSPKPHEPEQPAEWKLPEDHESADSRMVAIVKAGIRPSGVAIM